MSSGIYRRFFWGAVILIGIILIGTIGYWVIGGRQYSFVDALDMTVITITTVGFQGIIDQKNTLVFMTRPEGRDELAGLLEE